VNVAQHTQPGGVLVTGGCSGIGRAVVEAHHALGDTVVVLDRNPPAQPLPEGVQVVQGDVTSAEDNARAVTTLMERAGRIDHFVGNAGIHDGGFALGDVAGDELGRIMRRVLDVDVVGYALGAHACRDRLAATGGCMTFTLSDASFVVDGNGAGLAYSAAKHAGLGLVRHLAAELAPTIRVNAVAPGGVVTGLVASSGDGTERDVFVDPEGTEQTVARFNPLGTVMSPAQLAQLYLFLASPAAAGMTGEVLRPDGGLSVGRGSRSGPAPTPISTREEKAQ
jgi:2,3-dihydroxy-2,3-dihydrophenylpropionate dehydrogenase